MISRRSVLRVFGAPLIPAALWKPARGQGAAPEILGVIPVGDSPAAVAINPMTNQAFVANRGSRNVAVLDLAKRVISGKYEVGGIPEGIAVNPRTGRVVVAGLDGLVTLIDDRTGTVAAKVQAGSSPSRVAVDPLKNLALVTNFNGSNLVAIDLSVNRIVKTIRLKNGPLGIAVLEEGRRAVVACQYDMVLLIVNYEKGSIEREVVAGQYLSEVAVAGPAGPVLVGNPSSNGIIAIYDPVADKVLAKQPVGAGPLSIAAWTKRNVALVAEYNGGSVSVLDMKAGTVVASVKVGQGPRGVAVHPESGVAVVIDKIDGTATFLDIK
jgi:YVTN family beta-propeller protein